VANEAPDRSLLWPAVLVGVGVAGSLDEIVLHQLLRWHHFYDRGSQAAGLIADGIFHLGSTAALVIGLVLLVQRWRTARGPLRQSVAGVLVGAGGFNLYDGVQQPSLRPGVYRRGRRGAAGRAAPAPVAGSPRAASSRDRSSLGKWVISMGRKLDGVVVVITGASSGTGRATGLGFAERGA
jgi:hypothetical protein